MLSDKSQRTIVPLKTLELMVQECCNGMFTGHSELYKNDLLRMAIKAYEQEAEDAKN